MRAVLLIVVPCALLIAAWLGAAWLVAKKSGDFGDL